MFSDTETLSSHGHCHIGPCIALLQDASGCAQKKTLRVPIARQANGLVDLEETPNPAIGKKREQAEG